MEGVETEDETSPRAFERNQGRGTIEVFEAEVALTVPVTVIEGKFLYWFVFRR